MSITSLRKAVSCMKPKVQESGFVCCVWLNVIHGPVVCNMASSVVQYCTALKFTITQDCYHNASCKGYENHWTIPLCRYSYKSTLVVYLVNNGFIRYKDLSHFVVLQIDRTFMN